VKELTASRAIPVVLALPGLRVAVTERRRRRGGYAVELCSRRWTTVIADAGAKITELLRKLGAEIVVARGDGVANVSA